MQLKPTDKKMAVNAKSVSRITVNGFNANVLIQTAENRFELANNVIKQRDAAFAALRRIAAVEIREGRFILASEEVNLIGGVR